VYEALKSGALSQAELVAALAYAVIALATLSALAQVLAGSRVPLDRMLIWPLFIATYPAGLLRLVPWLFPDGSMRDTAVTLLNEGAPLYLAGVAVIVIVIFLAQWRRARVRPTTAEAFPPPVDAVGVQPITLTALTLAAITVVPELLATHFRVPMLIDGRLITTIVAVVLATQGLMQRRQT
jgi:hypothetical protein